MEQLFKPNMHQPHGWFLEIAFVHDVSMCVHVCVPTPEAINYIHMIFNLYNQPNKFIAFRNVTKLSMHGVAFVTKHIMIETKVIRLVGH